MSYVPRRSSARWLENAPREVLACYDNHKFHDRYTVFMFDGEKWPVLDNGKRTVFCLAISEYGSYAMEEVSASNRAVFGKKVAWETLPQAVKDTVRACIANA